MENYLIIGASSGIGRELALMLKFQGHEVYGTYYKNRPDAAEGIHYFPFAALDSSLDDEQLPDHLNGLAYCPGSISLKPFSRLKQEGLLEDMKLNVFGAVNVIQKVLPKLKQADQSSIVLFSTVAVQLGLPFHTTVSMVKGALEGLTRSLAAELAPKVRVNAIAPSLTDTPLAKSLLSNEEKKNANAQRHPLRRVGESRDIANMAAFLLTDQSSWISGQILPVDGGMSSMRI
ncbi:SDR family oxidoreductase [Echinicola sp. CAU 1574]|uniref:SDR family oxidoreductase n=1 Tax=Echinicola arenosa TaxID=2774144 RepID=A0ABR9ALC4_9BACT|nr:SDR family oxidoreductase [Echinicola arenosa]MBD8489600.1 SDR family oxidoreductase [Echinicola arenosa]